MSVLTRATVLRRERRRRTYLRADDRRAQILDVAKGVFARRGYHRANVADLCRAARIGRGTLYQYFDNKRDVLLALLEEIAARVERQVAEIPRVATLPGIAGAPRAMIVDFSRRRFRQVLDALFVDEATLRLLLREARGLDGGLDAVVARIDRSVLAAMESDLRAAQKAGLLRPGDPRLIARYVLGGIEKIVLAALADDEPVDLDVIVKVVVDLEMFGLLKDEVRR